MERMRAMAAPTVLLGLAFVQLASAASGPTTRRTEAPACSFAGVSDHANRIVYFGENIPGMLQLFEFTRPELCRSVKGLVAGQAFNIILLNVQAPQMLDPDALLPVNEQNVRRALGFSERGPWNTLDDPTPGLRWAFTVKPDVIYLFMQSDFGGKGNEAVVEFCRKQNPGGRIRIHTIAYIARGSEDIAMDLAFVHALKTIARDSGGQFLLVYEEQVGDDGLERDRPEERVNDAVDHQAGRHP